MLDCSALGSLITTLTFTLYFLKKNIYTLLHAENLEFRISCSIFNMVDQIEFLFFLVTRTVYAWNLTSCLAATSQLRLAIVLITDEQFSTRVPV